MKAHDLKLDDLVRFCEGRISLQGRRLVLHDLRALNQLRADLITMVGPEPARRIFTRFGYFWGEADAAALKRVFKWDSLRDWLLAMPPPRWKCWLKSATARTGKSLRRFRRK